MGLSSSSCSSPKEEGCFSCRSIEKRMNEVIFYPPESNIDELSKHIYYEKDKVLFVESRNGKKISLFLSYPIKGNSWFVWAHGNGECVHEMIPYLRFLQNNLGIGFIIFDYQGYGCSEGKPSEKNCYADIQAVMDYAINTIKINKSNIYLVGRSLGTGVVIHYAYKNNWKNPIILISPYKTIVKVVYDSSIVRPIDKFRSASKIGELTCPIKIFHGVNDELIDLSHGKYLYDLLRDKSLQPVWINEADHNNILYHITINDYMEVINHKR